VSARRFSYIFNELINFFSVGFTFAFLAGLFFNPHPDVMISLVMGAILVLVRALLFLFNVKIGSELKNG
jgi:uncharacterized membrane protein YjjP (DUF1212 family)